jgi:hypothetical protein
LKSSRAHVKSVSSQLCTVEAETPRLTAENPPPSVINSLAAALFKMGFEEPAPTVIESPIKPIVVL